jgi:hypothetical protein
MSLNLPKSATLAARDGESVDNSADRRASLTKGVGVVESVQGIVVPELTIFNDYVAVLRCKRKSDIVLTGNSEYSNIGIIVGFGGTCVNKFVLSQQILFNGKGGAAIAKIEGLPPEYVNESGEDREVVMVQERNIFYSTLGEEDAIVLGKDGNYYCRGEVVKKANECCSGGSCCS